MTRRKYDINFWIFVIPMCVFFVMINVIPFLEGIALSLQKWNGVSAHTEFVGLSNYIDLFQDKSFFKSFQFTLLFVLSSVLLVNALGFGLALAVEHVFKLRNALRTVFFLPQLIGGLVIGYIWKFIFTRVFLQIGESVNIGILQTNWFSSKTLAFLALLIVFVWQYSGYLMVIYIAALQGVAEEVVEASKIDGARPMQTLLNVTMPMIAHSFTICLFLAISTAFKVYDLNVALTNGTPFNSTESLTLHIYREAFEYSRYGYGAAQGVVFSVIIGAVTLLQMWVMKKREVEL